MRDTILWYGCATPAEGAAYTPPGADVPEDAMRETRVEHRRDRQIRQLLRRYIRLFRAMHVAIWELDVSAVGPILESLGAHDADAVRRHFATHPDVLRGLTRAIPIERANAQAIALFGLDATALGSLAGVWPDESLPVLADAIVAAVEGRLGYSSEASLRAVSGAPVDVLLSACLGREDVKRGTVVLGLIDISDRTRATEALRQAKERYEYLFQYMPIALWQIDARALVDTFNNLRAQGVEDLGRYLDAHPGFLEHLMDALRVDEVNQHAVHLFGARDAAQLRETMRYWAESPGTFRRAMEARYRGETVFQEEARFRTLDGRLVDALFTAARPGPPDRLNASIIGLIDVTERTRAQERLRQVQSDLAHTTRVSMLGELVASIAHEINQPLAAIIANGGAGIRWLDRPQPELQEALALLQRIVADADRAADIIRNIRAMAARRDPALRPLEFAGVVRESSAFLKHEFRTHNVTVLEEIGDDLPEIEGDRTQLQQVLVNLLLNAVQAMAGDSLRRILRIRARRAGRVLQCSLEDSGPGIPEDDLPNLFESFFTTKPDGLGMGLAICRSIVESHGGNLEADNASELGGARFTISLPSSPADGNPR